MTEFIERTLLKIKEVFYTLDLKESSQEGNGNDCNAEVRATVRNNGINAILAQNCDLFSLCGCGSSVLFSFHHQDWEPGCGRKMLAHLKCYDLCSVQFLNIITLK